MNSTFNPYRTTRAARRYVSPRTRPLNQFERETRGLSYMLKDPACPEAALQVAAAEMAALVWGPCHLIPAPDHTGDTTAGYPEPSVGEHPPQVINRQRFLGNGLLGGVIGSHSV